MTTHTAVVLAVTGWALFLTLVAVWIGRDRAAERKAREARKQRRRADYWQDRARRAETERVARVIQFPIGGAS